MMNYKKISTVLILLFISLIETESRLIDCLELIIRRVTDGEAPHKYSYNNLDPNGPSNWPGLCNTGTRQSPIVYDQVPAVSPSGATRLRMIGAFNTRPQAVKVVNNGHGAAYAFVYSDSSVPQITGGPLGNDIYSFHSFHFHYPCEHMPLRFALSCRLEVHFVHFNTKYGSIENAIDKSDGLAVIGVMYGIGLLNSHRFPYVPMLSNVYQPNTEYSETTNVFTYAQAVGFTEIPKTLSYLGSLTTPKCDESVTWLVVDQPYSVSLATMAIIRNLRDAEGNIMLRNNRPTQPLNGRTITKYNEL